MNITITGNLGGGKSSVCKELEKYGFKIITGGGLFRDIASPGTGPAPERR